MKSVNRIVSHESNIFVKTVISEIKARILPNGVIVNLNSSSLVALANGGKDYYLWAPMERFGAKISINRNGECAVVGAFNTMKSHEAMVRTVTIRVIHAASVLSWDGVVAPNEEDDTEQTVDMSVAEGNVY